MAIVVQSDKQVLHQTQKKDTLGPGRYENVDKFKNICPNYNSFNSTDPRFKNKKNQQINPGPGAYDIKENPYSEKVLVSFEQKDMKSQFMEIERENQVFKSKLKRFHQIQDLKTPGPGEYLYEQAKEQKLIERSKTLNIIQILKKSDEYQNFPSIPGIQEQFGYSENEVINSYQNQIHSGEKNDQIGPGQYNIQDQFFINAQKSKGYSMQRQSKSIYQKATTEEQIGPGIYSKDANFQMQFKQNMSSGFASNSQRIWDQRKGALGNKFIKERNSMKLKSKFDNNEQQEFEYIDDCVPGPGHYHNNQNYNSFKSQTFNNRKSIGSTSERKENLLCTVGPGDYNPQKISKKTNQFAPFNTFNKRFETDSLNHYPGPGRYQIKNTIENKKNNNQMQNFGSNVEKNKKTIFQDENPGPGYYINPDIISFQNYKDVLDGKKTSVFLSTQKRNIFPKDKNKKPAVGDYELNQNTIQMKSDLKPDYIQKPPFNIGQKRPDMEEIKIDKSIDISPKKNFKETIQLEQHNRQPFNTGDKRFKNENPKQNQVGPGEYDPQLGGVRDTFNILFAKI